MAVKLGTTIMVAGYFEAGSHSDFVPPTSSANKAIGIIKLEQIEGDLRIAKAVSQTISGSLDSLLTSIIYDPTSSKFYAYLNHYYGSSGGFFRYGAMVIDENTDLSWANGLD